MYFVRECQREGEESAQCGARGVILIDCGWHSPLRRGHLSRDLNKVKKRSCADIYLGQEQSRKRNKGKGPEAGVSLAHSKQPGSQCGWSGLGQRRVGGEVIRDRTSLARAEPLNPREGLRILLRVK